MGFDDAINGLFADPATMTGVTGGFQMFILLCAYGYVLAVAASMISEGSELLLLIPSLTGTVGSIVLPVRAHATRDERPSPVAALLDAIHHTILSWHDPRRGWPPVLLGGIAAEAAGTCQTPLWVTCLFVNSRGLCVCDASRSGAWRCPRRRAGVVLGPGAASARPAQGWCRRARGVCFEI